MQMYCHEKEQLIEDMLIHIMSVVADHCETGDFENADAIASEFIVDGIDPEDHNYLFLEFIGF